MPFKTSPQKFNAAIGTVEIGSGDKKIRVGGQNVLPFYTFDAPIEHAPKVGWKSPISVWKVMRTESKNSTATRRILPKSRKKHRAWKVRILSA